MNKQEYVNKQEKGTKSTIPKYARNKYNSKKKVQENIYIYKQEIGTRTQEPKYARNKYNSKK